MNNRERFEKKMPLVITRLPVKTRDKLLAELHKRGMTLQELLTSFADGQGSNLDS